MSRRTAEANKAILVAWNKEQELVQEGKGTREWTPKQQRDILNKGKAYDEDGVAFQGQHMKSAEKYPEYQGDPENIQFLTRAEHLEAHGGDWRNPTNWYFNPITKEKKDFGDGRFIPCEIIQLTKPIIKPKVAQETVKEVREKAIQNNTTQEKIQKTTPLMNNNVKPRQKWFENPEFRKKILEVGTGLVVSFVKEYSSSRSGKEQAYDYQRKDELSFEYDDYENAYSADDDSSELVEHSSPNEHMVKEHRQRYHTKKGTEWREKKSFSRGGKKNE